jgi:hypothetical protein
MTAAAVGVSRQTQDWKLLHVHILSKLGHVRSRD